MLKIESVRGENFRSFKSFEFKIKEGLWVVKGTNKDDTSSDSNGSGKSTLFCDSIVWCLTGNTVEGLENDDYVVNFKTKKDCFVEVVLRDNEHETKIMRTRKHSKFKNNLFLEIDGQSLSAHRVKDTQDRVNQIIKISPALLKSTIIMSGDITNRFSELTPKDRIALLESVRDYKVWSDFREETKSSLNEYLEKIQSLKDENLAKNGEIGAIQDFIESLTQEYLKEKEKTFSDNEVKKWSEELSSLLSKNGNEEEVEILRKELLKRKKDLSEREAEKRKSSENLNKIYQERSNLNYLIKTAQEKIKNNTDFLLKDSVCPTCGQKIILSEDKKMSIMNQLSENKKVFKESHDKLKEIDANILKMSNEEEFDLSSIRENILSLSVKISSLEESNKFIENKIDSLKSNIKIFKENVSAHEERIESLFKKISEYKVKLIAFGKIIKENEDLLSDLDKEREAYQFFYDSLGPRGNLRPYLLRKDISYLNKVLQYYTARLYPGYSIKLTIPTIENNKIDILFENSNNMIKPISVLSKGERKRLDLCLQFAIYDLIKSTAMFDTNILILDEIFESLDVVGINHVVNMLEERTSSIPSIYVISHNPNAYDLIPKQISVSKINDISKVVFKNGDGK